jgi:hypothetical protein
MIIAFFMQPGACIIRSRFHAKFIKPMTRSIPTVLFAEPPHIKGRLYLC